MRSATSSQRRRGKKATAMNTITQRLIGNLRALVSELGKAGGTLTPSIYDTAHVLRHCPPEDVRPGLEWLLAQQQADGGWGPPAIPLARHVPTLAAILTLSVYDKTQVLSGAI